MPRKLGNITTGGQLLGIFGGNFIASIRWPLILTIAGTGLLIAWRIFHDLDDQQQYFCLMRMWAGLFDWFEFSPTKEMMLNVGRSERIGLTASQIVAYGPVVDAWTAMKAAATSGVLTGLLFAVPGNAGWWILAEKFGSQAREEGHEKGAILTSRARLLQLVRAYNRRVLAELYERVWGPGWQVKKRLTTEAERDASGIYRPYEIAGVPYPAYAEQSHTMLVGSTGKGKTVILRDLVSQARARGDRAVVFDLTGAFVEAFYEPERDTILNPLDTRCPYWSIFDECRTTSEFQNAAKAVVPQDGGSSDNFWVTAARLLFVTIAMKLQHEGRGNNVALRDELMNADLKHVHKLAENSVADPLTAPEAARMAESIRATFNTNAFAFNSLPTDGPRFCIKEWVQAAEPTPGSILFLTSRHVDLETTRMLLTLWMDTAVNALMCMDKSPDRLRMWFMFDELGALHRLASIESGMQTARNYGGAFVLGIHAFAKLKDTYGENIAQTLSSYANTKMVLGTADRATATWASDSIGHRMFREMEEGYSYGQTNVRDAVTMTPRKLVEPLVMPDQLMKLPKLRGYLSYPEGMPVALVPLKYRPYPIIAKGFIERQIPPMPGADGPSANPQAPAHGPGGSATSVPSKPAGSTGAPVEGGAGRELGGQGAHAAGIVGAAADGESVAAEGVAPIETDERTFDPNNAPAAPIKFVIQHQGIARVDVTSLTASRPAVPPAPPRWEAAFGQKPAPDNQDTEEAARSAAPARNAASSSIVDLKVGRDPNDAHRIAQRDGTNASAAWVEQQSHHHAPRPASAHRAAAPDAPALDDDMGR